MGEKSTMEQTEKKGLAGSTLKLIAIITMLIDHSGVALLEMYMKAQGHPVAFETNYEGFFQILSIIYIVMRLIGRLAFPIFCFLLVEGFFKTRNRIRYSARLFAFALISEVPFDLSLFNRTFNWNYQNVYFTLLIGLLTIWGMEGLNSLWEKKKFDKWAGYLGKVVIMAAGAGIAQLLHTDYGMDGVLAIAVMYLFYKSKTRSFLFGTLLLVCRNLFELPALLGLFAVRAYDGRRGWKLKYLFYLFYPGHLIILYAISVLIIGR